MLGVVSSITRLLLAPLVLGLAAFVPLVRQSTVIADGRTSVRTLSGDEAASVRGGVGVDSYHAHTSSSEDNLAFNIDWATNPAYQGTAQTVGIFENDTKLQTREVSGASGTWKTRTLWPISGYKTFKFKWLDASYAWTTTYSGGTHRVNPDIHMVKIRIWNTTIDGVTTAVNYSAMKAVIDNLNFNYLWESTNSVDALFSQCLPSKTMQLRLVGVSTLTLGQCDYPIPGLSGSAPYYGIDSDCIDEMADDSTADGSNTTNLIILNNMGDNGWHLRGASTSNPTWHAIAVKESWTTDPGFIRTLAHELGCFTPIRPSTRSSTTVVKPASPHAAQTRTSAARSCRGAFASGTAVPTTTSCVPQHGDSADAR